MARRCGTSAAVRPVSKLWAARKPRPTRLGEAAVPVAQANRQRANRWRVSESLDDPSSAAAALPLRRVDVPHRPRLPSYPPVGPTDRLRDLYESLSTLLGITCRSEKTVPSRARNGLLVRARSLTSRGSVDFIIATNVSRPDPSRGPNPTVSSLAGSHRSRRPPSLPRHTVPPPNHRFNDGRVTFGQSHGPVAIQISAIEDWAEPEFGPD